MIGNTGLLVYAGVIGFTPLILAAIACQFFKPELLRPISALQGSAEQLAPEPMEPAG